MLNERLKNLRLAKGMTLQQVGDAFGISKASVSSWESGKSHPDHKKLEKLAELFCTSVQYLIAGMADNANPENTGVPFLSWNSLSSRKVKPKENFQRVTPLHSRPGKNSFATRYPGSSERNWQFNGVPAGSLLIVDPDLKAGPLDTVLVQFEDNTLRLAKFEQTPENKKILVAADTTNFQPIQIASIKILGVALEWQLSGKIN
jgi:transcriptional regulator with XRE-family HTH domain